MTPTKHIEREADRVSSRMVWPITIVMLLMLGFVVWTGRYALERVNAEAARSEIVALRSALDAQARTMAIDIATAAQGLDLERTTGAAVDADAVHNAVGLPLSKLNGFHASFLVTAEGGVIAGTVGGRPATPADARASRRLVSLAIDELRQRQRVGSRPVRLGVEASGALRVLVHDALAGRLVSVADRIALIAAAPLIGRSGTPARVYGVELSIVGVRWLDDAALSETAARLGQLPPRVTGLMPNAGEIAFDVPDADGQGTARVAWLPGRPADAILSAVTPSVLGAVCAVILFALFVYGHVRRTTRELARRAAEAKDSAMRDPLSRLPNRLAFVSALERECARLEAEGGTFAVHYLDLDRFKEANDRFGHSAGDAIIKEVAARLGQTVRGSDLIARLGGDEFGIVQSIQGGADDATALARRIIAEITKPVRIGENDVRVGVSIGIALAPENGRDATGLVRCADSALYRAKAEGRNRALFYDRENAEAIEARKLLEADLRAALSADDQLYVVYQPQVSADGSEVVGVEALARWRHPTRGFVSPGEFIPIAEECGLIAPLGELVLRQACVDARRWPGLTVAVNVSPIQFRQKDFVAQVKAAIESTGFDPSRLELELTEGVLVDDADHAEAEMMELRAIGVSFALDDFGTGYSSLIYLRRFPFDKIKIDRSFLDSLEMTGESAILVHSIVHLGRALGLTVIAEGVETDEQHRFLQAVGCHEMQGYLFAKPVPADELDIRVGAARDAARRRGTQATF